MAAGGAAPQSGAGPEGSKRALAKPAYTLTEAAHYLHLPRSTVDSWVRGRLYAPIKNRQPRPFEPAIVMADPEHKLLSFENLVEMHVLSALRKRHQVPMPRIRTAMGLLRAAWETDHPFARPNIFTDGRDVFARVAEMMVNASAGGQYAFRQLLEQYLQRVDHSPQGIPIRLYPLFGHKEKAAPKSIAIDPLMRFGQPFIVEVSIPTKIVAERVQAGEPEAEVAQDYRCSVAAVRDAVEFERRSRAA